MRNRMRLLAGATCCSLADFNLCPARRQTTNHRPPAASLTLQASSSPCSTSANCTPPGHFGNSYAVLGPNEMREILAEAKFWVFQRYSVCRPCSAAQGESAYYFEIRQVILTRRLRASGGIRENASEPLSPVGVKDGNVLSSGRGVILVVRFYSAVWESVYEDRTRCVDLCGVHGDR